MRGLTSNQKPRRALAIPTTTVVLTVVVLVLAGVIVFRSLRRNATASKDASPGPASSTVPSEAASSKSASLFQDVTAQSGIDFLHVFGPKRSFQLPEQIGSGGAFFDFDNDGDLDVYLVQSGIFGGDPLEHRNKLFRNDGQGRFVDVSQGSGADLGGYGMGCAAADADHDGDVDLFVTRFGRSTLLANRGDGTFEDVTETAGTTADGFATSAAFLDFDRDGRLDLYVTRYVDWTPAREDVCYAPNGARDYCGPLSYNAPCSNVLYRGVGGVRFENISGASGIGAVKGNGLAVIATDLDGDGWVDIYVANDQTPAFLWINQRNGTFVESAAILGAAFNADGMAIAGMGIAAEDIDGDADFDLLVTNIRNQSHLCLRNDGGYFEDVSHAWGFGAWSVPWTAFGLALFDQDHDGRMDGVIANGAVNMWTTPYAPGDAYAEPNQFIRQNELGRFVDASAEAGPGLTSPAVGRAVIAGDYDNDGDVDVLLTANGGRARLLRNENRSGLNWLMLDLIPDGGARHALNARMVLTAGGRTIRREVRPHAGYLSSHDPRVHVGLGSAKAVDRLEVTWPNGRVEQWSSLAVNRIWTLRQGTGQAEPSESNAP